MTSLESKIQEDMKQALKAGDKARLETLRGLLAQIKDESIKKRPKELTDEDVLAVIRRGVKRRKESIELYKQGNRQDLVEKEQKELEVLQKYLPQQLSREEIEKIVNSVIEQVGATSIKDLGKVMGPVMKQLQGRADGKEVQQIVRERLS
jgi:uncharacterized protein YqeY